MADWENLKFCQEILLFVLATHNNRSLTFFLRHLLKTAYSCEHVSVSFIIQKCFSQGPECYSFEMFSGFVVGCFFFFWLYCVACEILLPWPGIKPTPLADHWTGREFSHRASVTVFVTGWNPNFYNCQWANRWPKCVYTDQLYWAGTLGRSPREGNGNPFQYSGLKNPDRPQSTGSQRQDWVTNTFTFTLLGTPTHTLSTSTEIGTELSSFPYCQ